MDRKLMRGGVQDQLIELPRLELDRKLCDALLESIDETITALLSREVDDALYLYLQRVHSISRDEIPHKVETFCSILEKVFGRGSKTVSKAIARKFYAKLGLTFSDNPGRTLIECVEEAKIKLGESDGQL
jgi:hypothetical protein